MTEIPVADMNIIDQAFDEFVHLMETFSRGKSFELAVHKAILAERDRAVASVQNIWVAGEKMTLGEVLSAIRGEI